MLAASSWARHVALTNNLAGDFDDANAEIEKLFNEGSIFPEPDEA